MSSSALQVGGTDAKQIYNIYIYISLYTALLTVTLPPCQTKNTVRWDLQCCHPWILGNPILSVFFWTVITSTLQGVCIHRIMDQFLSLWVALIQPSLLTGQKTHQFSVSVSLSPTCSHAQNVCYYCYCWYCSVISLANILMLLLMCVENFRLHCIL